MYTNMQPGKANSVDALIDAAVRGELDEAEALRLCKECPELVTLALLAAAKRIAELQGQSEDQQPSPATPSGMVPIYTEYLFTFLDYPYVTADNNFGERQIRPAVILRKNSQSNRSDRGAATQAVLMSVYRTLRLRGLNPTKTITNALKTYLTTGELPPLPT